MEQYDHKLKIFACTGARVFAEQIAQQLNTTVGESELTRFSDGEFQPQFTESVRGATVFIVQSTNPPADNLFELLLMIDAARDRKSVV